MNKMKISSTCKRKDFEILLLNLSQNTLINFTYFGKITKKNVEEIITLELKDFKNIPITLETMNLTIEQIKKNIQIAKDAIK